MELFLRAFKPANNLTLAQRAEIILHQQRIISDELKFWTWFVDRTELDIRQDSSYDIIYAQVKKGMNAKMVKITRYNPNDTPDLQSSCIFVYSRKLQDSLVITHRLGFFSHPFQESESISIDKINNPIQFESQEVIEGLVNKIISSYKPITLYLSSKNYFHSVAKNPDNIPWTGWLTYLDNSIKIPATYPDFCEVKKTLSGNLFKTTSDLFNEDNPQHTDNALKLEKWFVDNSVLLSST